MDMNKHNYTGEIGLAILFLILWTILVTGIVSK
jgi:hypothetical protein